MDQLDQHSNSETITTKTLMEMEDITVEGDTNLKTVTF